MASDFYWKEVCLADLLHSYTSFDELGGGSLEFRVSAQSKLLLQLVLWLYTTDSKQDGTILVS
jgi:hypothetical protein